MVSLKNSITATALAVTTAFGVAAPAMSAQTSNTNDSGSQAEIAVGYNSAYSPLTAQEALEASSGKVLLHIGEGFPVRDAESLERLIEGNIGLDVEIHTGGMDNQIGFFFYKNPIGEFTFENSTEIYTLSKIYAQRYQMGKFKVASNDLN